MADHRDTNGSSPSTTWAWRRVKIGRPPEANHDSRPKAVPTRLLAPRDARKPLSVTVVYRGGPECWWEIRARGAVIRRPGVTALHDVLNTLQGDARAVREAEGG